MPCAAMVDLSRVMNNYIACGYMDLHLGIDSMAAIVMSQYGGVLRGWPVSVLWAAYRQNQSPVLVRRRLCIAVQATEQ